MSDKLGIYAAPVNKKMQYMEIAEIPKEFVEDIKNKKNPQ